LERLVAAASVESAALGIRSFAPKWRAGQDETANPMATRYLIEISI
jgi:hypothetical protein